MSFAAGLATYTPVRLEWKHAINLSYKQGNSRSGEKKTAMRPLPSRTVWQACHQSKVWQCRCLSPTWLQRGATGRPPCTFGIPQYHEPHLLDRAHAATVSPILCSSADDWQSAYIASACTVLTLSLCKEK